MLKIKNGGLDQYDTDPFEQQQFGTAGVELEWVNKNADTSTTPHKQQHLTTYSTNR